MKIETSIKPRRDGTVRVSLPSGSTAEFKDVDGLMVCDIKDDADIGYVLNIDGFYPHDDEPDAKEMLLAKAKELGAPGVNGRMSTETIAAKIDAFKAAATDEVKE